MPLDTWPFWLFQWTDSNEAEILKDILSQEGSQWIIRILSNEVVSEVNDIISDYLREHSTKESLATISSVWFEIKKVLWSIEQVLKWKKTSYSYYCWLPLCFPVRKRKKTTFPTDFMPKLKPIKES